MKRCKLWLLSSLLLYLGLLLYSVQQLSHMRNEEAYAYRVEINRLMDIITKQGMGQDVDLEACTYVLEIQYLSREEAMYSQAQSFFQEAPAHLFMIQPVYLQEELAGYVKFRYELPDPLLSQSMQMMIIGYTMFELFFIVLLLWLRKQFLQPLQQLQSLPQKLSQGHYHQSVTQEKHSPFNPFLLSISQLQDDLQTTEKRRLELEKQKKQMILTISHDIKTPLHMIQLYSKAIAEDIYENEADRNKAAERIHEKTKEIEVFIDEIVKTSREDILDIQVQMQEFYLKELMKRITEIYEEQCELRKMELFIEAYENRLVKGDIDRLQEVMENLFINAFKYGDGRRIEITFYEEEYHLMIRFFNTGSCVSPQEYHHLFDSFFRGANAQGKSGSGLGLYICKEIMRKMEGDIFCELQQDGMAFILVLA